MGQGKLLLGLRDRAMRMTLEALADAARLMGSDQVDPSASWASSAYVGAAGGSGPGSTVRDHHERR
ncbi:hypothetical protein BW737_004205 [Actinomyces ruminis]|uniref:Uncharacterized protein n=1 Tax=Actinomyces ruminis TaxID=1937003 RepID=A0ABX4MCK3_9ACTO|nr:hypothetical protein BW737_004205 [Actinomyces ruminis]